MSIAKTHTIIVDEQTGDRIEFEYDRSDRVWNIYAIDGKTGYPIRSNYAGSKAERDVIISDEAPAWFEDEEDRKAARAAFEMFGTKTTAETIAEQARDYYQDTLYSAVTAEDEPEPDEITAYMRRQAFGDYSRADAATREEMEAAALDFAAQEQARLTTVWQEAGARQARERYEADEATARDLIILQDAGAITAEDVANYYRRHGWTPRKYHRN